MSPIIERISDESLHLGEAPHWDAPTQTLYYVDILEGNIHKYKPSTKEHAKANVGKTVSFIIPVEEKSDQFIVGTGHHFALVTWDGVSDKVSKVEKIVEVENRAGYEQNHFNDGKADPTGKLWAGTMGGGAGVRIDPKKGTLYSLGKNRQVKSHFSNIHISNGLAWSADLKKFYFIDSGEARVDQYDYDVNNESLANGKLLFTLNNHNIPGFPDGQAIDAEDNIWVAIFNGSRVIKIDSKKPESLLDTIVLPAEQITSVAFGGANLDELYVTTARVAWEEKVLSQPENGAVYKITGIGFKGLPGVPVKLYTTLGYSNPNLVLRSVLEVCIHKYKPSTKEHIKANVGDLVSFIIPIERTSNQFIVSLARHLATVTWDGVSDRVSKIEKISQVDNHVGYEQNRFNDGKADSTGKLWAGTMGGGELLNIDPRKGTLYSLGKNRQVKSHFSNIHISNGLAWSADLKKFYYIDSGESRADQYDYDVNNERIANRQPLFSFQKNNVPGFPDGQATDTEESLWLLFSTDQGLLKLIQENRKNYLIPCTAEQVTSVIFIGAHLDKLYVTTARVVIEKKVLSQPENGAVYRVTGLGVKGLPGVSVKL